MKVAKGRRKVSGQDAEFDTMLSIWNGEQYSTVFVDTNKLAELNVIVGA